MIIWDLHIWTLLSRNDYYYYMRYYYHHINIQYYTSYIYFSLKCRNYIIHIIIGRREKAEFIQTINNDSVSLLSMCLCDCGTIFKVKIWLWHKLVLRINISTYTWSGAGWEIHTQTHDHHRVPWHTKYRGFYFLLLWQCVFFRSLLSVFGMTSMEHFLLYPISVFQSP